MCAGIRDAANLAWKLATVLQLEQRGPTGNAAADLGNSVAIEWLLESYESERRPHVR